MTLTYQKTKRALAINLPFSNCQSYIAGSAAPMPTLRHLACQRRKLLLMSCCLHGSMSPLTSALCRTGTMLRRKSWGVSLAPLCLLCRLEIVLESWMLAQVPSHYFSLGCFSKVWLELLLFYCGLGLYHLNQSRSIQQSENNDIIIF